MIKQVGIDVSGVTCWCGKRLTSGPGSIQLGCGCYLCYSCLVGVIKSWTRDISKIQEWGIPCPFNDDCEYKQRFSRTFYLSDVDIGFLVSYGEANHDILVDGLSAEERHAAFLDRSDMDRLNRFQVEKRLRISCGCRVGYLELTRQIRCSLEDAGTVNGIECPQKSKGACRGVAGMFIHRFEVAMIFRTGSDYEKHNLFPAQSSDRDIKPLSEADLQAYDDRFHRHVRLQCNCMVHYITAMKYMRSMLAEVETADSAIVGDRLSRGAETLGVGEEDISATEYARRQIVGNPILRCPHGKLCQQFAATGTVSTMIAQDIDDINKMWYEVEDSRSASSTDNAFDELAVGVDETRQLDSLILSATCNGWLDLNLALINAIDRRHFYEVKFLLLLPAQEELSCTLQSRLDLEQLTDGITPLRAACRAGHEGIVSLLLDQGASCNNLAADDGRTALHEAASCGHAGIVSMLLKEGVDVSLLDREGKSALDVAIEASHGDVTRILTNSITGEDSLRLSLQTGIAEEEMAVDTPSGEPSTGPLNARDTLLLKGLCGATASAAAFVKMTALASIQQAKISSDSAREDHGAAPITSTASPHEASLAYMNATTKKCPNPSCGLAQTHYHGHHCHHVKEGCYSCKTHFCYRCLATAEENRRERGEEHVCKCGGWSGFCESEDLLSHLVLLPYPHDSRCACPICPECRPGLPCQGCDGTCVVCRDLIQPGPSELAEGAQLGLELQTQEQRQHYRMEERNRELFRLCRAGDTRRLLALLKSTPPAGVVDANGMTLLHWASMRGRTKLALLLVARVSAEDRAAFIDTQDSGGCTALHYASQEGHLTVAISLLWFRKELLDVADVEGATPLFVAIRRRHYSVARLLLAMRASVAATTNRHEGILSVAAAHCRDNYHDLPLVEALLDRGAPIDAADANGQTALMQVCKNSLFELATLLLDRGASVNLQDEDGRTALIHVVDENISEDLLESLLERGADTNLTMWNGYTALLSVSATDFVVMAQLLLNHGASIDVQGYADKNTALIIAAENNQIEMATLLLNRGAAIDLQDAIGCTALMAASKLGYLDVARLLITRGANLLVYDAEMETALSLASTAGQREVVELLFDELLSRIRGSILSNNRDIGSALVRACGEGHIEIATFLLHRGVIPDAMDTDDSTALIAASCAGVVAAVSLLLEAGADVNLAGKQALTPLMFASHQGHVEVAKLLLDGGASINMQAKTGMTALMLSATHGYARVVALLLDYGADVNFQTRKGDSALSRACVGGHLEVIALLLDRGASADAPLGKTNSALISACRHSKLESAILLLDRGANIDARAKNGTTALMVAGMHCDLDFVRFLIGRGAAIDDDSGECETALFYACTHGLTEVVILLLDHGAKANRVMPSGWTPLRTACGNGHLEVASLLLDRGASVNLVDQNGATALMSAVEADNVAVVSLLLDRGAEIDVRGVEYPQSTPLAAACSGGFQSMIQLLLLKGTVIDARLKNNSTALMRACSDGQMQAAELLLAHGADIDLCDNDGWTALLSAACEGYEDVVRLLLDKGAAVDAEAVGGYRALFGACEFGLCEIAKLLLQKGANLNLQIEDGRTPLIVASSEGHRELVRLLLDQDADVNVKDNMGATALISASANGNMQVIDLLLDHQSCINAQDNCSYTPLIAACSRYRVQAVELLLNRGADVELPSRLGFTPLMTACLRKRINVVKLLLQKGANVNAVVAGFGLTALSIACGGGLIRLAQLLLAHGAVISLDVQIDAKADCHAMSQAANEEKLLMNNMRKFQKISKCGITPLLMAAGGGNLEVVRLLLDHARDKAASLRLQFSPFYEGSTLVRTNGKVHEDRGLAENTEAPKVVRGGVSGGSEEEAGGVIYHGVVTEGSQTTRVAPPVTDFARDCAAALAVACAADDTALASLLLDRGAEIDWVVISGRTPLTMAVQFNHIEMVRLLLNRGATIDLALENRSTALSLACSDGHIEIARLLLEREADINLPAESGRRTPLMIASREGHTEMVRMLLNRGAVVAATDRNGLSAAEYAANDEIRELLLLPSWEQSSPYRGTKRKWQ